MNNKTALLVGCVCIVVVIAAAAYFLTGDSDEPEYGPDSMPEQTGLCYVYGNANGDHTIDSKDVSFAEYLAGQTDEAEMSKNVAEYRFADVNRDGIIDSKDVEMIQAIVDKKVDTVDIIDTSDKTVTVKYPMKDLFVVGGTNMRVVIEALDMCDCMTVVATNDSIGDVLDKTLVGKISSGEIKTVTMKATSDDISALSKLHIDTMIRENKRTNSYASEAPAKFFKDKGIASIDMDVDSYEDSRMVVSTLAFLIGHTDTGKKFIDYQEGVVDDIKEKLGNKFGTVKVMTVTISNSVSGTSSDYFAASEYAGGDNIADFPEPQRKYDPEKTGDYWLLDPKYNPAYMFHFKSMNYGSVEPSQKDIDKYRSYFSETKAYENGNYYLLNGIIPLPARIAYMAEFMYPEEMGQGYGDKVFQQYIDDFTDVDGWDVSGHKVVWSVKDF